ncbi:MAG: HAMP domain-containing protein, partial [Planctomycetes bacterium]|nr:HAMP domain-containing protein [Planctomycetota bacterium]
MGFAASLRARLTLVLVLVNLVVLGALALWSAQDDDQQSLQRLRQQSLLERSLSESLRGIETDDARDLAGVLQSPLWQEFEDAVVIDQRLVEVDGAWLPGGAFLNPLGSRDRPAGFPLEQIVEAAALAVTTGEVQYVAGGLTMPLVTSRAGSREKDLWGGVYVKPKAAPSVTPLALRVMLFAFAATFLGAALIYLLVGRTVLRPVERLAVSAHEFGAGGRPALPAAGGAREVDELVQSFGGMMERIRGFQLELEREGEAATSPASLPAPLSGPHRPPRTMA